MSNIAVITTFANQHFDLYAKKMLESYANYWPKEVPLLVQLDDDSLYKQVDDILRPQDAIFVGRTKEHQDFVDRNKDKDDPNDYRKQPVRFCHKVFAIKNALNAAESAKAAGQAVPRYLIWLDADVHTTKPVSMEELKECLPKEGDAVAYLGRKDWPHSECGWLAFDLENGGEKIIELMYLAYANNYLFQMEQWHDSWVFDHISWHPYSKTNLTADKPGMDIWQHSPMAKWSVHYKGPVAKQKLAPPPMPISPKGSNIMINTKNAIPDEQIKAHIAENQRLINHWVRECLPNDEQIVVVSAGPQLIAEDVRKETGKIVAVKHALGPLKKAGITPWACILLDPRPHVADFVKEPATDVIWFVASQVDPKVTLNLLAHGCTVWGYHAAVGAGEGELTSKQPDAVVNGGSATATRGLYLLKHLGFHRMKLYGYDLSFPDKPNLNEIDEIGQPKYIEFAISSTHPHYSAKRCFWSEPQLIAQFEEMRQIVENGMLELEAEGEGIVPFIIKSKHIADLRRRELRAKISGGELTSYQRLLKWNHKTNCRLSMTRRIMRNFSMIWHRWLPMTRQTTS